MSAFDVAQVADATFVLLDPGQTRDNVARWAGTVPELLEHVGYEQHNDESE